jgi:LysR family transcriptional regulator, low CO2-responsive transcriptional regulator
MSPPNHLNLDAVQAFSVFAEYLNFSTAAAQLHLSQPALHAKVRKLAEQLGLPLYCRVGRTLVLTPQGSEVARLGRELSDRTQRLCDTLAGTTTSALTLAAGEGAYMELLHNGIRHYLRSPTAKLTLRTANREDALKAVREGRAHLGAAPLESVPDDLHAQPLTSVGQMLVLPRHHRLATRRSLKLKDLANCALIVPPEGRPHRTLLSRMLQSEGVPWTVAVEANGWELMIRFVQTGIGLAVVNACCQIPSTLRGIPLPELPQLHYHLFRLRDAWPHPAVEQLAALLHQHANDWRPKS